MKNMLGLFLLLSAWTSLAGAANFCVTSSAELQAALDSAESNGQDDIIRVVQGSYTVPNGGFSFAAPASEDGFDLSISGGFVFSGPPFNICSQPLLQDPEQTVLNGAAAERVLNIRLPQSGSVDVRNLSFINGLANDSFGGGGGFRAYQNGGQTYGGTLTVENNVFLLNSARSGGGLYIGFLDGTETINVRVLNNLFVSNQATSLSAGAGVIQVDSPANRGEIGIDPRPAVVLAHNTVVDNTSVNPIGGFWLLGSVTNLWVVSNNFWGNSGDDLTWLTTSPNTVLRNNNIEDLSTNPLPDVDIDNISVTPQYVNCGALCVDRVPEVGSPLIDAGWEPLAPFQPWVLPGSDLNGEPRKRGTEVDIGAYEGIPNSIFSDRFEDN